MFLTGFTWYNVVLFFLYQSQSSCLCPLFEAVSSNRLSTLSQLFHQCFFGSHCNCQLIFWQLIDQMNSVFFLSEAFLLRWLTFLILELCDCRSPPLLGLFFSSDPSICFIVAFASFGNSDHVVVSVSSDFPSNSKKNAPVNLTAFDYPSADWDGLWNYLRNVPLVDIF